MSLLAPSNRGVKPDLLTNIIVGDLVGSRSRPTNVRVAVLRLLVVVATRPTTHFQGTAYESPVR